MAAFPQFPVMKLCNPCGGGSPPYEVQIVNYGGFYDTAPGQMPFAFVSGWSIVDSGTVVEIESPTEGQFFGDIIPLRDTAVKIRAMLHAEYPNRGTESCSDLGDPVEYDILEFDTRQTYLEDLPDNNHLLNCGACPFPGPLFCSQEISNESTSLEKIINVVGSFDWAGIPTWARNESFFDGNSTARAYLNYFVPDEEFLTALSFIAGGSVTGRIPFGLESFSTDAIGENGQLVPPYEQLGNPPFVGFRYAISRPRIRMLSPGFCRLVTVDAEGNFTTVLEDLLPPRIYRTGEIVEPTWDSARFLADGIPSCLLLVELGTDECL